MFMRIFCDTCGNYWEVYGRDNWHDDKARQCPHCYARLDKELWERQILPAFGATSDANAEILKAHAGEHKALFTIDFISDSLYQNYKNAKPQNNNFI